MVLAEMNRNTGAFRDCRPGEHFRPLGCSWASVKLFHPNKLKYAAETHMGIEFLTALILGLAGLGGFSKILIRTGKDKFERRRPIPVVRFWKLI